MTATKKDLYGLRTPYVQEKPFTENELVSRTNPMLQFHEWFEIALGCHEIKEPNAFCLATSSLSGQPSCRMLLMKHYSDEGFKFFTNYKSRKACDLYENPKAAMLFFWPPLHRQVRIEGIVSKLNDEESTSYFTSRPVSSQISAIVSPQSREVSSRQELEISHKKMEEQSLTSTLMKPDHWGGYILVPHLYEFWQGQSNRLHDRLVFTQTIDNQWTLKRLAP